MSSERTALWLRIGVMLAIAASVIYLLWLVWDHQAMIEWMRNARVFPFFLAMTCLSTIGVPITPFFVLAGATFGTGTALIGTLIALAVHVTLCYWIGRTALRPRLVALLQRFGHDLPDFDDPAQRTSRAARFTTLISMTPMPGVVKKYGLGAARVPFAIAFAIQMLITGAYAASLIVLGYSVFQHDLGPETIILLVAAAIGLIAWRWSRRRGGEPALALRNST
jgi:uncharacterized membrane protein YdjX (TVP38/TMEM64 family)